MVLNQIKNTEDQNIIKAKMMKAIVFDDTLKLDNNYEIKKRANEVLIKVLMGGVCNTDLEIIKGYMGYKGILGHEFVGIVEQADNNSLIGKRVAGEINCYCGECVFCKNNIKTHCPNRTTLGIFNRDGAFAEYVYLPEKCLHILPESICNEEAVFIEPIAAAFQITEQIPVKPEDKIIVLGDGKLGLLIAQVLSLFSNNIVAVGKHENKLNLLPQKNIKTVLLDQLKTENIYDIVVEATGSPVGLELAMSLCRPKGTIVLKTTIAESINFNVSKIVIDEINLIGSRCGPFKPAIQALAEKNISVKQLITDNFKVDNAIEAFERAKQKGTLKVLIDFS